LYVHCGHALLAKAFESLPTGVISPRTPSANRLDESTFDPDGNSFGTTHCVQFCQDRLDVSFYRVLADIEHLPDLLIAAPICDILQDLALPLGQFRAGQQAGIQKLIVTRAQYERSGWIRGPPVQAARRTILRHQTPDALAGTALAPNSDSAGGGCMLIVRFSPRVRNFPLFKAIEMCIN